MKPSTWRLTIEEFGVMGLIARLGKEETILSTTSECGKSYVSKGGHMPCESLCFLLSIGHTFS